MSNAQALIKHNVRRRFYAAVVFLSAITQAYRNNRQPSSNIPQWNGDTAQEALFKDFLNTLCQFCDLKPGGDSVTACTVLNHHDRFEYRFACNRMNKSRMTKSAKHLQDLLFELRSVQPNDGFQSLLLGKVLCFCRNRIHHYLGAFKQACKACQATQPTAELKGQLQNFSKAAAAADFKSMEEKKWVPLCEGLIGTIGKYYRASGANVFTERATQGAMSPGSNCWSELRHYAGRLRSYSHGVRTLVEAAQAFPMLFENPQVNFAMSSRPDENPIQNITPARKILRSMVQRPDDAARYIDLFDNNVILSRNVEQAIQDISSDENFKPIVHAELLVLQSLERDCLTHPSVFFNSWKYIGASKPTCRLCHHYFEAHRGGFKVRPTHGNLYTNWKPPDVLQREGEEAIRAREYMLNAIVKPIRSDALRTLDDQVSLGRQHDSSTGMTVPVRAMVSMGSAAGPAGAVADDDDDDDDMETFFGE